MSLTKIDQAIVVMTATIKKKRKRIDAMGRKVEISESQKIFMGEELDFIRNAELLIKLCKQDLNAQLGKLPPQATELEEAVLGAIMLEVPSQSVISVLETSHFYKESNKEIFRAIKQLWVEKIAVDMRTVAAKLRKSGKLEVVGGAYYIAELTSKVSSIANVDFHVHVLIEMAIKRELILMGGKVMQEAYEETTDCFDLLDSVEETVKEVKAWIR